MGAPNTSDDAPENKFMFVDAMSSQARSSEWDNLESGTIATEESMELMSTTDVGVSPEEA